MENEVKDELIPDAVEKSEGPSRRMFLAGTGGAALTVAVSNLFANRGVSQTSEESPSARATEKQTIPAKAKVSKSTKSSDKYQHLLSPIKIGNHVLKTRIIGTAAAPHTTVGPEHYPSEELIASYGNKAREGAAVIVMSQPVGIRPNDEMDVLKIRQGSPNDVNPDHGSDSGHFPTMDLANAGCQNVLSQLTEAIHFYGSLVLWKPKMQTPAGYDVSTGNSSDYIQVVGNTEVVMTEKSRSRDTSGAKEITVDKMQEFIEDITLQCALAKECGFDGMYMHMGYRGPLTARFLSPQTNRRTDKYGGSLENRARFCIELMDAIKKRCGQDHFLMGAISGNELDPGGYTIEDGAAYAELFTGHLDLLSLKGDGDISAPSGFIKERTPFLYMTEAYKKLGVTLPLVSDGGFTNLDWAEEAIATGKTDTVGVARAYITTPNLGRLAYEGRNEDVVPCIRCNWCHGNGYFKPWTSLCTVNPTWGLENRIDKMVLPPTDKKKVAVIGGGPAGMEAALTAARRGHTVTLYEKTGSLGGLFKTFENVSFKWAHKDYKEYMVRQVNKAGVRVRLNTEANPEMIKGEWFDAVIVAIGAEPYVPNITGIKGKNVVFMPDVFGKEDTLAKDVVIIGGGYAGVETAMHLAEKGHKVTILEVSKIVARDAGMRVHFYPALTDALKKHADCNIILQAHCNEITGDGVTYLDTDGKQQFVKSGSVVIAVGIKARTDQAFEYHDAARRFFMVGDCGVAGNERIADAQNAIQTAFGAASML